jgi:hypothetical protein
LKVAELLNLQSYGDDLARLWSPDEKMSFWTRF